jgi:hypothetical protein
MGLERNTINEKIKSTRANALENETFYVNVVTFAPSQYFIRYLF